MQSITRHAMPCCASCLKGKKSESVRYCKDVHCYQNWNPPLSVYFIPRYHGNCTMLWHTGRSCHPLQVWHDLPTCLWNSAEKSVLSAIIFPGNWLAFNFGMALMFRFAHGQFRQSTVLREVATTKRNNIFPYTICQLHMFKYLKTLNCTIYSNYLAF